MSGTQTVIGMAMLTSIMTVTLQAILPAPAPIVVHDLFFDGSQMVQDRTVSTSGDAFYAEWKAQIIDAETGKVACGGSGSWNYQPGRLRIEMPVERWAGDISCSWLPAGSYYPLATWNWGDDQTSKRGPDFVIPEASK